jgi:hypothetical protein
MYAVARGAHIQSCRQPASMTPILQKKHNIKNLVTLYTKMESAQSTHWWQHV